MILKLSLTTFLVFISQRTMQAMIIHSNQILKISLNLLIMMRKIPAVTLLSSRTVRAPNLFKRLKKRKSTGADKIANEHIINGGPPLLRCLRQLYSNILKLAQYLINAKSASLSQYTNLVKGEIHQIATGPLLYYLQSTSFSKEFSSKGCNTEPF